MTWTDRNGTQKLSALPKKDFSRFDGGFKKKMGAGRAPAFGPGQVVSRRIPSPVGLYLHLGKNGTPLWTHDDLIADESKDYGFGPDDAKRFIKGLVQVLGITDQYVRPAYEDIFYFLYKERRLPVNVDPSDSKLKDPEERARMTAVFEKDLGQVIGYVLPIQYGSWKTGPWPFKSGELFLYRVIHPSV